jgi:hypothetical protein
MYKHQLNLLNYLNMRPSALNACNTSLRTLRKPIVSRIQAARMSSSQDLNIETKHVTTAPGVKLTEQQETIVGSVLDLFAGRPSLPKLALWRDDATFNDPLTSATGREQYSAQWYGLQQAFSEINRLNHQVKDAGNPILMDLRTKYVIKGINKEQTIQSLVSIQLDDQGKISKVEDKWNGELPTGMIANVSVAPICSLNRYVDRNMQAFRHLNAVTVPKIVSVPKNNEEDAKKGNQ